MMMSFTFCVFVIKWFLIKKKRVQEDLMIFYKLFALNNQTAEAGTVQNIKHRFHHHKVYNILYFNI